MGSGFSSVKAGDGICRHHGLYLAMTDCCPDFLQRSLPSADGATVQDA